MLLLSKECHTPLIVAYDKSGLIVYNSWFEPNPEALRGRSVSKVMIDELVEVAK